MRRWIDKMLFVTTAGLTRVQLARDNGWTVAWIFPMSSSSFLSPPAAAASRHTERYICTLSSIHSRRIKARPAPLPAAIARSPGANFAMLVVRTNYSRLRHFQMAGRFSQLRPSPSRCNDHLFYWFPFDWKQRICEETNYLGETSIPPPDWHGLQKLTLRGLTTNIKKLFYSSQTQTVEM